MKFFLPLNRKGFTLVELAIALAVVGLVILGLFQLSTTMQRQSQDRQTAGQMRQMVDAVQNYLLSNAVNMAAAQSDPGNQFLINGKLKTTEAGKLAEDGANQITALRDYLPTNFNTANYDVYIRRMQNVSDTGAPNFQALILQNAQPALNDKRGGSLAAQVGAAGGFVYSDTQPAITGSGGGWLVASPDNGPGSASPGFGVLPAPTANMLAALVTTPNLVLTSNMISRVNTGNPEANTFRTSVALGDNTSLVLPPDGISLAVGGANANNASNAYVGGDCGPGTAVTVPTSNGVKPVPKNSELAGLNASLVNDTSYFGRIILGKNSASGTRAEVLICSKNDAGEYKWKSMMSSGVRGEAITDSSLLPMNLLTNPKKNQFDMSNNLDRSKEPPDAADGMCFWTRGAQTSNGTTVAWNQSQICPKHYYVAGLIHGGGSAVAAWSGSGSNCTLGCTAILCCPFD